MTEQQIKAPVTHEQEGGEGRRIPRGGKRTQDKRQEEP